MNKLAMHKFLTLKSFDTTNEWGRTHERYRLAALSMVANVLSRGISMAVMVLTVRLTAPYLGAERFGAWMTIASFVGMLTFLDLGVGNALTNKIAQAATESDINSLRRTVTGGLGFLFIISLGIAVLLIVLANYIPWESLIKVSNRAAQNELNIAIKVFSLLFALNIFANGIQRVFAGLQRAFESHFFLILGSLISLTALYLGALQKAGIPYLVASTLGGQILGSLCLLLVLKKRHLLVKENLISNICFESRYLLNLGSLFFVLQIGTLVGWGADSLIISSNLGAKAVAAFSIVQRLFQLVTQPMYIMNAPLWAAYADAHIRGDREFIRTTLLQSLRTTSIYTFSAFIILLMIGEPITGIWTSHTVIVSHSLIASFGLWSILEAIGNSLAMFLNGCNIVRPQVFAVCALCILALPLKYVLINKYGIEAMLVGFSFLYILVFTIFYGFLFKSNLKLALNKQMGQ